VLWLQDGRFHNIEAVDSRYLPPAAEPVLARAPAQAERAGILRSATSLLSWVQQQAVDQRDDRPGR
jgi:hypothetical protein